VSGLDLITDAELASEPVTDEPVMWRNWFAARGAGFWECEVCQKEHLAEDGEVVVACPIFPSKAAAEARVARRRSQQPDYDEDWTYLGAFPQGEKP
jgi:hypothetical protein